MPSWMIWKTFCRRERRSSRSIEAVVAVTDGRSVGRAEKKQKLRIRSCPLLSLWYYEIQPNQRPVVVEHRYSMNKEVRRPIHRRRCR